MFFYFFRRATSELRRPIAAKLCHMIAIWVRFIMQVQNFGRPKNWGLKTCKIRRDFRQLQNSIANISREGQDIQNRKDNDHQRFLPRSTKKSGELWSTNYRELYVSLNPPKLHFRETIFRPLGGAGRSNFNTHYRLTKPC